MSSDPQRTGASWSGRMNPFVRWPGHRVLIADPATRSAVRARALAACFAFAAFVSAMGLTIAHLTAAHRIGGFALVVIALALALLLSTVGYRLPDVAIDAAIFCGTALVSVGLALLEHNAPYYAVLYVWLGGFAFYFLPRRRALVQLALIALGFALSLVLHPIPQGGVGFLIVLTSATLCGGLVMTLREGLEMSDHRFEQAFMAAPIGIALIGQDGRFLRANDAICRLLRRSEAEVLALRLGELWHPDDEAAAKRAIDRAQRDLNSSAELEHRYLLPSGAARWARTTGSVVLDDRGQPLYGLLQVIDVTERREAGEAANRLAAIVESSEDAIVSTDVEGRITSWNKAAEDLYGYPRAERIGEPFTVFVPPERREEERQILGEVMADQRVRTYETCRVCRDGRQIEVSVSVSAVHDVSGTLVGTARVSRDISPRRRMESALAESEERYRQLFESSPVPMGVFDRDTLAFLAVNDAALLQYGYSREEFLAMTVKGLTPAGERDLQMPDFDDSTHAASGRVQHARRDGTVLDVEVTTIEREFDGRAGVLVVARDVTEQVRDRDALARSEERYRMIIETAAEGIWMLNAEGRTVFVNPRMAQMLGYEPAEMIGRPAADFMGEEGRATLAERRRRRREGEQNQSQEGQLMLRKDGTVVHTLVATQGMRDDDGLDTGVLALVSDVTERVRADQTREQLEKQLSRSQRLEGIGRLAGGIAHDFNNLLAVILNYAEFVVESTADRPAVRDDAEEIRKAAERAAGLTQQLLVFSRREVAQPQVLHLDHVVRSMERLLRRTIGEDIALKVELDPEAPAVCADRGQFEQLLLNLVVNARDAMPDGGELRITVGRHTVSQSDGDAAPPGDYVRLLVGDTGAGIPPDAVEHIFEPFFTTKGSQAGSGLGLATVYGVATQRGGHVDVSTGEGKGTTFRILLPAIERQASNASEQSPETATEGGTETVLLVEDEPAVRSLTARILDANGYHVLQAADGEGALRLADGVGAIDLLLTDLVMPGMSGKELADELERRRPGLRLLFMSGYTDDVVLRHGIIERRIAFLEKPFSSSALLEVVRATLDDAATGALS